MKTSIVIKFSLAGLHAWKGVEKTKYYSKVGYLAAMHRHRFHFEVEKEVSHDDRDIEIIDFQNEVISYLKETYGRDTKSFHEHTLNFGQKSCEMLAKEVLEKFDCRKVTVLEDGENGATVRSDESAKSNQSQITLAQKTIKEMLNDESNVIFICGELCSGKSTLALNYYRGLVRDFYAGKCTQYIEVSGIVKRITKGTFRSELQGQPQLDHQIILEIKKAATENDLVVVSGVRQRSILEAFRQATMIWINTPKQLMYERFVESGKDLGMTHNDFRIALSKDRELGLDEVKEFILSR